MQESETVPSRGRDLYAAVTDKIVEALEAGAGRYERPWHTHLATMLPHNAATHAAYRGVNVVGLWLAARQAAFPSGFWASYRQWQGLGAQVRKGERGSLIVFYRELLEPEGEEEAERPRVVLKASHVFNAAQVEGWEPPSLLREPSFDPNVQADAFVQATGARVRHGFNAARYRGDLDDIEMPSPAWFTGSSTSSSLETYYATLLHELTHWSGAKHRLDRDMGTRFGDETYAFEELVAEIGAAFLCAELGIANEPRPDHAAYLAGWLAMLKRDKKAIFLAARKAQQAMEYLFGLAEMSTKLGY